MTLMRALLTCLLALGVWMPGASASHFRYGHISYTTPDPLNPRTVDITVDVGWRSNAIGGVSMDLGDGQSQSYYSYDTVSAPLNDAAGESYVLVSKTFSHTFPAVGDYEVQFSSCCRVGSLVNAANQNYRVSTTVKIGTDLSSVKARVPAVVGIVKDAFNDIDLLQSMFDPDGDSFTCAYHPSPSNSAGYAPVPQRNGVPLSVTPDCRLQWDLTGYNPSTPNKWAVSLVITNSKGVKQSLDFVVELGAGSSQVTCADIGHSHGFTASAGDHVHVDYDIAVTNAPGATVGDISVQTIGLPQSAMIRSPLNIAGFPTDPLPAIWSFHWMVPDGTPLGQYVVNVQWLYPSAGTCLQTIQVDIVATPIEPPGSFGDPHIVTWAGEYFDFMGSACDVVLAKSQSFGNNLGLAVHTRLKARYEYSFIESAAVQIGDAVLEVAGYGAYIVDGVSNAELPMKLADKYLITKEEKNQHDITFTIHVNDHERILVKAFKDLVSVRFDGAENNDFADVVGLMGDFKTGQRFSRDRSQIMLDDNAFGQEWQVQTGVDPELFLTKPEREGTGCMIPNKAEEGRRQLGESISVEAATEACKYRGTKGAVSACIYDVIAFGDLEVAAAGAF